MTDLEITKRCAEAMGYFRPQGSQHVGNEFNGVWCSLFEIDPDDNKGVILFNPLTDDAQCFALVKRFDMVIEREARDRSLWGVTLFPTRCYGKMKPVSVIRNAPDLNRAICECVANMSKP